MNAEPQINSLAVNDIRLSYAEWYADRRGDGPVLLYVHATGFHGRLWDEIVQMMPEVHTICVDLRGHGHSTGGAVTDWAVFGDDLVKAVEALGLTDICAVGHSMGGHALIEAAGRLPDRFRCLVLIDPVVMPPAWYEAEDKGNPSAEEHPTARRRNSFGSPDEMYDRFRRRSPYIHFSDKALRDYCEYGLMPAEGGGYKLACDPLTEASIYSNSLSHKAVFDHVDNVACPAVIVRAKPREEGQVMDFTSSPTWPGLAAKFRQGRDLHWAEHTHFIPMEVPEKTVALIRQAAGL